MLRAEEKLRGPVADAEVYDVVLAATGSKDAAADAYRDRVEEKNRRGEWVDI